jgi:quinol monooxygenase YgiN
VPLTRRIGHISNSCNFQAALLVPIMSSEVAATVPISLVVTVEILEDRIAEFLDVIEKDAIGSRNNENGGCLRFDVLRDHSNPNKFHFYEVYVNEEAINIHKAMPHFQLWTDFKASGGVASQSVVKADAIFYTY